MLKRIVNVAKNHKEARKWDIQQAIKMTHEERQEVSKALKVRVYGTDTPDVRASLKKNIK